jgi:hypothetical protein
MSKLTSLFFFFFKKKWNVGNKNLMNSFYSGEANGFRVSKNLEKAKTAYEKASQGQQMLSSYPYIV